jgi:hypothetical protein
MSMPGALSCRIDPGVTGGSGADELAPKAHVVAVDLCRCEAKRRFRHHVSDDAGLGVVMTDMAQPSKQWPTELDEIGRRHLVKKTPHFERHLQVVDHRCTREQRCAAERDPKAALNRVLDVLAFLQVERWRELPSDSQRESLVRAGVAAAGTLRLEAGDLSGPVRHPIVRYMVG